MFVFLCPPLCRWLAGGSAPKNTEAPEFVRGYHIYQGASPGGEIPGLSSLNENHQGDENEQIHKISCSIRKYRSCYSSWRLRIFCLCAFYPTFFSGSDISYGKTGRSRQPAATACGNIHTGRKSRFFRGLFSWLPKHAQLAL